MLVVWGVGLFFFFKQKTAYEVRISDWSSDVCSSDLHTRLAIDFHCHRTLKNEDLHPVAVLVLLDERAGREAVKGGVYAILALEDRRFVKRNAAYARRLPFEKIGRAHV